MKKQTMQTAMARADVPFIFGILLFLKPLLNYCLMNEVEKRQFRELMSSRYHRIQICQIIERVLLTGHGVVADPFAFFD